MKNVGGADRVIRIVIGLGLLSLFYFPEGYWKLLGLTAVIPLMTAATQSCLINKMLGRNTCSIAKRL